MIRRGQDSNLQSSGHEPDELTNSSTPHLPLRPQDGISTEVAVGTPDGGSSPISVLQERPSDSSDPENDLSEALLTDYEIYEMKMLHDAIYMLF